MYFHVIYIKYMSANSIKITRLSLAPVYKAVFNRNGQSEVAVMYDYDLERLKQDAGNKLLSMHSNVKGPVKWKQQTSSVTCEL